MKLDGTGKPERLADKPIMAPTDRAGPFSADDGVAFDPLVTVLAPIGNPVASVMNSVRGNPGSLPLRTH